MRNENGEPLVQKQKKKRTDEQKSTMMSSGYSSQMKDFPAAKAGTI